MAKKIIFPIELYAVREDDGDEHYFASYETAEGAIEQAGNRGKVGVYRLVDVREAQITQTLKRT